jgi:hypothetical protein
MNREETKELIKVMQAYVDGEIVQVRHQADPDRLWADCVCSPDWFFHNREYRIKPKPRIIWVVQTEGGSIYSFGTDKKDALSAARVAASMSSFSGAKAIPYRELTEEERRELEI